MVLGLNQNTLSENNLFGTMIVPDLREEIMKKKMIDKLLIPLFQQKWDKVNENYILFSPRFRAFFKDEMYLYLLKTIGLLLQNRSTPEQQLVFVLPPIQLKPEYEIYKLLFGIPKHYDDEKLKKIKKLLKKENITFDKIKTQM
jgi:hypothetical protein